MTYDIAVIGGGIVGLSFAMQATESFLGFGSWYWRKNRGWRGTRRDTTAGDHSGVYYKEGSLEGAVVRGGAREMWSSARGTGFRMRFAGSLIVATNSEEAARLEESTRTRSGEWVGGSAAVGTRGDAGD